MNEKFIKFLEKKDIKATSEKTIETVVSELSAEKLAGLYNEYNEEKSNELKNLVEAKSEENAEAIKELKAELLDARTEQMKHINENLKQQGIALKKLTEAEKTERKGANDLRTSLEKNWEAYQEVLKKGQGKIQFETKVPGTMTIAGNVSGGNVPVEQRIPGFNIIPSRRIRLFDIVQRGTANSNVISWVYQANKDGAAGGTAEGTTKNQIDFDLVVDSEQVKKFTAYIKVSDEMKNDIDFMETEINNELTRELSKVVETQIYEGDDSALQLNGIRTVASAFSAGSFAASVDNANEVDVLRVAANQIKIAEHDAPNWILMHPSDVLNLKLTKVGSADNRYVDQLQEVAGQLLLDGIPIVETTLVTQDEYLIGNFQLSTVWDRGAIDIEMGLDGSDFINNLMTIRAEWRGTVVVKNNDRTAFVAGVFSTDIAALETP